MAAPQRRRRVSHDIYDGNAARNMSAPAQRPRRQEEGKKGKGKGKVVTLTPFQQFLSRLSKIDLSKRITRLVTGAGLFILAAVVINGQVQLAELSANIGEQTQVYNELKGIEVQYEMEINNHTDVAQLEAFVTESLGMEKVNSNQITYVNFAKEDKGEVLIEPSKNIFEEIIDFISNWLS